MSFHTIILLLCSPTLMAQFAPANPDFSGILQAVRFTPNQGQWNHLLPNGSPAAFHATMPNGDAWFSSHSVHYAMMRPGDQTNPYGEVQMEQLSYSVEFVGALETTPLGNTAMESRINYIRGLSDNISGIPQYAELSYPNIYRNTDLRYYSVDGHLKYDFILKPGSDISDIQLHYQLPGTLALADDGSLLLQTPWGQLTEAKPIAWQDLDGQRRYVEVRYIKNGETISFEVCSDWDSTQTLIIDPYVLLWSTYVGIANSNSNGGKSAYIYAMHVDDCGDIYLTGTAYQNFPTSAGAINANSSSTNSSYLFACKLNASGSKLLWATYVCGASGNVAAVPRAITANASQEPIIGGTTYATNWPTTTGAYQPNKSAGIDTDGFILKLNNTGTAMLYSTYMGGQNNTTQGEFVSDIFVHELGGTEYIYMTGSTGSVGFPTTTGAYSSGVAPAGYLVKVNPAGGGNTDLVYGTVLPNASPMGVRVDAIGLIFMGGSARSGVATTANAYSSNSNNAVGFDEAWIARLNPAGTGTLDMQYSSYYGGGGSDQITGIDLDASNMLYGIGTTSSNNLPTVSAAQAASGGGFRDAFVVKFDLTQNGAAGLKYATYVGGSGDDRGNQISVNRFGEAWFAGGTSGSYPVVAGSLQGTFGGGSWDMFIGKLNASGNTFRYGSYAGGNADEASFGTSAFVHVDYWETVTAATYGASSNFPVTNGAYQTTKISGNHSAGMVLRFQGDAFYMEASANEVCAGDTTQMDISFTGTPTGPLTFRWFGDDGFQSSDSLPQYVFPSGEGQYRVNVSVQDANGDYAFNSCGDTLYSLIVYVRSAPELEIGPDTSICATECVQLFANATDSFEQKYSATIASPINIPDDSTTPATSSISVAGLPINSLSTGILHSVCLDITHGNVEDLVLRLTSPGGTQITLSYRNGGINCECTQNYDRTCFSMSADSAIDSASAPFLGGFIPEQNFSAFNGQNPNGSWLLSVSDHDTFATGTLNAWDLNFRVPDTGISYMWHPSATLNSAVIANPIACPPVSMKFHAVATNTAGCASRDTLQIIIWPLPNVSAGPDTSMCAGDSIQLQGVGQASLQWSPSSDLSDDTIAMPISYSQISRSYALTATDTHGCKQTDSMYLTIHTPPVADAGADTGLCLGDTIVLYASGGSSYAWTPTQRLSNPTAGTTLAWPDSSLIYFVEVSDANGCTSIDSVEVLVSNVLIDAVGYDASCHQGSDGYAVVEYLGGHGSWQINWATSPTQHSDTAVGLKAGSYTVTVTDSLGCSASTLATVNHPSPMVTNTSKTDARCFAKCDGQAIVQASGGTGTYTWNWTNGQTSDTATLLCAGWHHVTVTDSLGCTTIDSSLINEPNPIVITTIDSTAHCGQADGRISSLVTGGTQPYVYLWRNSSLQVVGSQPTLTAKAGSYFLFIKDSNNCEAMAQDTIPDEPAPVAIIHQVAEPHCFGGNNGSLRVSVAGTGAPYNILWSNGASTDTAHQLAAGIHSVTVTDQFGCTASDSFVLGEPTKLMLSIHSIDANCSQSDGKIWVTATGAIKPYAYQWNTGATTDTAFNVAANVYQVVVTDSNGCMDSISGTVSDKNGGTAAISEITPIPCFGYCVAELQASITGGTSPFTYQWSNNDVGIIADSLCAGQHAITITDNVGCKAIALYAVQQPTAISIFSGKSDVLCADSTNGMAFVIASGGNGPYQYLWSHAGQTNDTISSLAAGSYVVTVTDAKNCTKLDTIEITEPLAPQLLFNPQPTSCAGGNDGVLDLVVAGGTQPWNATWATNPTQYGFTASGLLAGTYTVTLVDANNCVVIDSAEVSEPAPLQLALSSSDVRCATGQDGWVHAAAFGGTPGYQYTWYTPSPVPGDSVTSLASGMYIIVASDTNGCMITDSVELSEPAPLSVSWNPSMVRCHNGQDGHVIATPGGGTPSYTFNWSNGSTDDSIGGLATGTYRLTITDSLGCLDSFTVAINEPTPLNSTVNATNITCPSGSDGHIDLSPAGGVPTYSYVWSPQGAGSASSNLAPGQYAITVQDQNGCGWDTLIVLIAPAPFTAQLISSDASCSYSLDGEASVLSSTGGTSPYEFKWLVNPVVYDSALHQVGQGIYQVELRDSMGCLDTFAIQVNAPTPLQLDVNLQHVSCFGLHDGEIAINVSGGSPGYTFAWSDQGSDSIRTGLAEGTYAVTVRDANGCLKDTMVVLLQPAEVIVDAGLDKTINFGFGTLLEPTATTSGAPQYYWTPSGSLTSATLAMPFASPEVNTWYTLVVTDAATGCTAMDTVHVTVIPPVEVHLPTAITPNGDGHNDVFGDLANQPFDIVELKIFNRWGQVIYVGTSPWNGTYKGRIMPLESYAYAIAVREQSSGRLAHQTGNVTVLR